MSMSDEYWSIDIPGLGEQQAHDLKGRLDTDYEYGVIVSDPRHFMTRGCDRSTVELLVKCLETGLASGTLDHLDAVGAQSLLEDFNEWLSQAGP